MRTTVLRWVLLVLEISALLAAPAVTFSQAVAQSGNDPWATPVNVSHSGAAASPIMVIDTHQRIHVLWKDLFAGYTYGRFDSGQWTHPEPVDLGQVFLGPPASQSTSQPAQDASLTISPGSGPHFMAGNGDYILGVWITGTRNSLYASRVLSDGFASAANWDRPVFLGTSAIAADVTVDAAGHAYLAYVRNRDNPDSPAGVYFQSSSDSGSTWSAPVALDQSPYFRTLTSDLANVEIAHGDAGGTTQVYVAWDNRPRKQVLFARSSDGGATWAQPTQIDGPTLISGAAGPFAIRIGAASSNILLTWQNGLPGATCTQLFKWSTDRGSTWSDRRSAPLGASGCAQFDQIIASQDRMILVTNIYGEAYLQAWDGTNWSIPQPQTALFGFEDPEVYRQVESGCRQFAISNGRLYVVGCDLAGGGDVWLTSRSLGDVANWFAPIGGWSPPKAIATVQGEPAYPVLVAGPDAGLHALWVQTDETSTARPQTAIYYSGWDGARWSRAAPVLKSLLGNASEPAVALDARGRLLVVWTGEQPHRVYFSWANASRAFNATEWSAPLALPVPRDGAVAPTVAVDDAGVVSVAYALPINEGRGIYVTQSKDQGTTWSNPQQVFDGSAAGWDMVSSPQLTSVGNGIWLLHWSRTSLSQDSSTVGLYFSRSTDGGQGWSKAAAVVEAPVSWWRVANSGGLHVYRVWTESRPIGQALKYQSSQDGGASWTELSSRYIESNAGDPLTIAGVLSGAPQLVQIRNGDLGVRTLQQWNWQQAHWDNSANLDVGQAGAVRISGVSAAVAAGRYLGVMFVASALSETSGLTNSDMFYLNRPISLTTAASDQAPVLTTATAPPGTPGAEPTLAATVQSTATPDISAISQIDKGPADRSLSGNSSAALITAVGLAMVITAAVFVFRLLALRITR